jgi:serine/threonine protein kinase
MSLEGQTLLHYRILEKIGEGGMGTVYKARDTHLDRTVAVKVLPHDKMADAERRQRFVQEAKSASSLNHPHIITVHDIASDGGVDFIVMEYVDGKTLDQLIGRKGLRLNEALGIAAQVADGLAKAHAAGIVHRDLKPTNVMVTNEGRVKILDFGLAKLVEDIGPGELGPTATMGRPDRPRTEEGFILGTMAYMSPEQAEGKKVDARTDIFSFGSVLYEMLTGQKAFHRDSRIATLASILHEEPKPAVEFNEALPPEVEQLLARCLRKDPQRRWQSMSDLKVVLQDIKEDSESGKLRRPQEVVGRRRKSPFVWIGGGLALIAAAVLLWIFLPKKAAPVEYELTRLTFDSGISWQPAFSPDGKMYAYSSDRSGEGNCDIWVQQVAGGPPLRLTANPAEDRTSSFSPDGSKLVFYSERDGGGIYEVATLGGSERRIADGLNRPRYSPDGAWIACIDIPASLQAPVKMVLVPAGGGTPVPFQPEFSIVGLAAGSGPVWSQDGQNIVFNGQRDDDPGTLDWWVAPVAGGPAVRTGAHHSLDLPPIWQCPYSWAGSYLYYATGTTVEGVSLFRVGIQKGGWKVSGPAERITSGAGMQYLASALPDGRLVYANSTWTTNIWVLEARPDLGLVSGQPNPVSRDLFAKFEPSLSRDGSRLVFRAFGSYQKSLSEVRLKDLATGEEKTFPMRARGQNQVPRISPDGSVISYRDSVDGRIRTFIIRGAETAGRDVCEACEILGFFADPNFALVREAGQRLVRMNIATGEKSLLLEAGAGRIMEPALSPDDRWVSFVLGKPDGRAALYVVPLSAPPGAEKDWMLLYDEDHYLGSPAWSPDGNRLYYLSERDGSCCLWTQGLDPRSKKPAGASRVAYRPAHGRFNLNFPRGNGTVAVGQGKIVIWAGEATGNIYLAAPKKK